MLLLVVVSSSTNKTSRGSPCLLAKNTNRPRSSGIPNAVGCTTRCAHRNPSCSNSLTNSAIIGGCPSSAVSKILSDPQSTTTHGTHLPVNRFFANRKTCFIFDCTEFEDQLSRQPVSNSPIWWSYTVPSFSLCPTKLLPENPPKEHVNTSVSSGNSTTEDACVG